MKAVEELHGMTHEDLVRLVQELQEENDKIKSESDMWFSSYNELKVKHECFKEAINNIIKLSDK